MSSSDLFAVLWLAKRGVDGRCKVQYISTLGRLVLSLLYSRTCVICPWNKRPTSSLFKISLDKKHPIAIWRKKKSWTTPFGAKLNRPKTEIQILRETEVL